jgi:hypothetical protein
MLRLNAYQTSALNSLTKTLISQPSTLNPPVTQSRNTLRELLETLAELEYVEGELSADEARQLAATFRTCRLQYMKQARNPLTTTQSHRLQQLDYRLQIVAEGQGSAATIRNEAIETLDAFNWSLP